MINSIKSKKDIRNEAIKMLEEGHSKQKTYNLLQEKLGLNHEIVAVLKGIPSKKTFAKFAFWNYSLLLILLTLLVILLAQNNLTNSSWSIFIVSAFSFIVFTKRVSSYVYISGMAIIGLLIFLTVYFTDDSIYKNHTNYMYVSLAFIPYIILPLWLEKKLCPSPKETKITYQNNNGQLVNQIQYEFID
jgi:hypothetical protein